MFSYNDAKSKCLNEMFSAQPAQLDTISLTLRDTRLTRLESQLLWGAALALQWDPGMPITRGKSQISFDQLIKPATATEPAITRKFQCSLDFAFGFIFQGILGKQNADENTSANLEKIFKRYGGQSYFPAGCYFVMSLANSYIYELYILQDNLIPSYINGTRPSYEVLPLNAPSIGEGSFGKLFTLSARLKPKFSVFGPLVFRENNRPRAAKLTESKPDPLYSVKETKLYVWSFASEFDCMKVAGQLRAKNFRIFGANRFYPALSSDYQEHNNYADLLSYFSMDYIHGLTISQIYKEDERNFTDMDEVQKQSLPFLLSIQGRFFVTLAFFRGLEYLQQHFVIHRDIKPDNIIVEIDINNSFLRVIFLDYGFAFIDSVHGRMMKGEQSVGTPLFMSPELMINGKASASSDNYAAAIVAGIIWNDKAYDCFSTFPKLMNARKQRPSASFDLFHDLLLSEEIKKDIQLTFEKMTQRQLSLRLSLAQAIQDLETLKCEYYQTMVEERDPQASIEVILAEQEAIEYNHRLALEALNSVSLLPPNYKLNIFHTPERAFKRYVNQLCEVLSDSIRCLSATETRLAIEIWAHTMGIGQLGFCDSKQELAARIVACRHTFKANFAAYQTAYHHLLNYNWGNANIPREYGEYVQHVTTSHEKLLMFRGGFDAMVALSDKLLRKATKIEEAIQHFMQSVTKIDGNREYRK